MARTDQDFQDGLALDLFSPTNRTLVVQQNTTPLAGKFVSGTTGEGFIALGNYSYIVRMNETANDLVAKIEIPYDPSRIASMGVQEGNTYVGRLAADKMSWEVDDSTRNVHRSENNTRIIKMTSLDGEYMLLGRQSVDVTNIFVQYGQGATRTVNVSAGGRQEAEFVDGLRFSMVSQKDVRLNADLVIRVPSWALPQGSRSVNTSVQFSTENGSSSRTCLTTVELQLRSRPIAILNIGPRENLRFIENCVFALENADPRQKQASACNSMLGNAPPGSNTPF
jgi:hypothetical protein